MNASHRQTITIRIALAAALLAMPTVLHAAQPETYVGIVKGVAVGGYDPVAYFTEKTPQKGVSALTAEYAGATWHFATEANRQAFLKEPARYAPQYGGYCAWAVSQGYTAKGDPSAWTIVDGKLYLNYDKGVQANWEKSKPANISKADANWPKVLAK